MEPVGIQPDWFPSETNEEAGDDRFAVGSGRRASAETRCQSQGTPAGSRTSWYGSFRFIHLDDFHPVVLFDGLDADPRRLSDRAASMGHLYEIRPDSPLITLVVPNPELERQQGRAPSQYRLPGTMFETIVYEISQREIG